MVKKGNIPWNKGLTKEIDKRVMSPRKGKSQYNKFGKIVKILYFNDKLSVPKIAKKLNIPRVSLYHYFYSKGIKLRSISKSHKGLEYKRKLRYNMPKKQIYDLYINKKLSIFKISKMLGCGHCTILKRLKRYDIPRRSYSEARKGFKPTEKTKKKLSKTRKRLYKEGKFKPTKGCFKKNDPRFTKEWFENAVKKSREASNIKPNKPEKLLIKLFKQLDLPYKYVGDGKFWIECLNPDFINYNGEKKIIEHFGDYWHNIPKTKIKDKLRLKTYKKYGYKTLVIWEHELKENINLVINKIKEFDKFG